MIAAGDVSTDELSLVFWLVCLACVLGAAYMAYLRNALACGLLVLVAIVAAFLAS